MDSADEVFWLGMSGRFGDVLPMLSGVPISLKIAKYTFAEDSHLFESDTHVFSVQIGYYSCCQSQLKWYDGVITSDALIAMRLKQQHHQIKQPTTITNDETSTSLTTRL